MIKTKMINPKLSLEDWVYIRNTMKAHHQSLPRCSRMASSRLLKQLDSEIGKAITKKQGWLWKLYCQIWYHFSAIFCKSKELRRPFTYWMRDRMIDMPWLFWPTTTGIFVCALLTQRLWQFWVGYFLNAFLYMLLAHLVWGTKIRYGQQEFPQFTEEG